MRMSRTPASAACCAKSVPVSPAPITSTVWSAMSPKIFVARPKPMAIERRRRSNRRRSGTCSSRISERATTSPIRRPAGARIVSAVIPAICPPV